MRIICDAPGQTCNRLWTYVASIARCIAEHRRMVIIFYDWTIEDFPNLLHCPFIFFPLWHKWYLERGNGWNNYKGLTWKVTHNKIWDRLFTFLGFIKGWDTRSETKYLKQTLPNLKIIFRPKDSIVEKAERMIDEMRKESDMVVGVHVRRGDYAIWNNGKYFYEIEDYHSFMLQIKELYHDKKISFFISSNEDFQLNLFSNCNCRRFYNEQSAAVLDLHTLSLCDRIIGPYSSYSRWASFIGEVPLCFITSKSQKFSEECFSKVVDYFHHENGTIITD